MYAKTVTLGGTHWEKTNEILFRNRRIGCRYVLLAKQKRATYLCEAVTFEMTYRTRSLRTRSLFSALIDAPLSVSAQL